jgi:hypothetical protein
MALATALRQAASAVIAAPGTSVVPSIAVPDNCHTVIVLNQEPPGGATVFVGNGAAGGALSLATGATPVPPASALALPIGARTARGGPADFIYDATIATTVAITYVNGKTD